MQTLPGAPSPLDAIALAPTAEVARLCASWAGRWLLVGDGRVHPDASALLGCFYGRSEDGTWLSSSPALLARVLFPDGSASADSRRLRYQQGIHWIVPPATRFAGVSRLLPSQILDLHGGGVVWRPLLASLSEAERADALAQIELALCTALRGLAALDGRLWLGLSAGHDSRAVLALCRKSGIALTAFTRITSRMSVADRLMPPELASECGYEHVFLRGRARDARRAELVTEHTAGHVSDGDALPFLDGDRDDLEGIAFGGHAFEIFTGDFDQLEGMMRIDDTAASACAIAKAFHEPPTPSVIEALQRWLHWTVEHPEPRLDWRDRFFLEQDNAGWLSSKEQLYDMNEVERFPIVNAARNYTLLLSLPPEQCRHSEVQIELIRRNAPGLLGYPFNPPDTHFGVRGLLAAKSFGLPRYLYESARKRLQRRMAALVRRRSLSRMSPAASRRSENAS